MNVKYIGDNLIIRLCSRAAHLMTFQSRVIACGGGGGGSGATSPRISNARTTCEYNYMYIFEYINHVPITYAVSLALATVISRPCTYVNLVTRPHFRLPLPRETVLTYKSLSSSYITRVYKSLSCLYYLLTPPPCANRNGIRVYRKSSLATTPRRGSTFDLLSTIGKKKKKMNKTVTCVFDRETPRRWTKSVARRFFAIVYLVSRFFIELSKRRDRPAGR